MNDACGCGAPLPVGARFCVRCGASADGAGRRSRRDRQRERRAEQRRLWAVPWLFVAPITAVALAPGGDSLVVDAAYVAWHAGLLLACGLLAGLLLGGRALVAGLRQPPGLHASLLALPAAALALLAGLLWVALLQQLAPDQGPDLLALLPPSPAEWLLVLLVAPLLEEWLCRGLLWDALAPFARPATRNAATAILFAFLHGLNGGYVLEVPHRFLAGLAFGWLRCRGRSLWSCVMAHFLVNLGAMLLVR